MKDNHSSDEHQQKVDVWEQMLSNYFYNKVLRPDTEKTYRKMVRLFLRYCGVCENALPLPDEVTHEHVLRWRRNELNIQKVRERTWNTKTRHMQSLYNYWIKKGIVSLKENPFSETQIEPGEKQKAVKITGNIRLLLFSHYVVYWRPWLRKCVVTGRIKTIFCLMFIVFIINDYPALKLHSVRRYVLFSVVYQRNVDFMSVPIVSDIHWRRH